MNQISATQQQILDRYAYGPELVETALLGLNADQLDLTLSPASWSIRQLVHHITDGDYLWKEFLLRAAGDSEQEFSLKWYWCLPQDEWVKRWSYSMREVSTSLVLLKANRLHSLDLLKLVPWLWERYLFIPKRDGGHELVTVGEVVEMQSRHVEGHVEDIRQIRQALGF